MYVYLVHEEILFDDVHLFEWSIRKSFCNYYLDRDSQGFDNSEKIWNKYEKIMLDKITYFGLRSATGKKVFSISRRKQPSTR